MHTVIATSVRTILGTIRDYLVSQNLANSAQVKFVLDDDAPRFTGNADILLWVGPFLPGSQEEVFDSRSVKCKRMLRQLRVIPRTRKALDKAGQAEQHLLADGGHFDIEEQILVALDVFIPVDGDGNALVAVPLLISDGGEPVKGRDPLWSKSRLIFGLNYLVVKESPPPSP